MKRIFITVTVVETDNEAPNIIEGVINNSIQNRFDDYHFIIDRYTLDATAKSRTIEMNNNALETTEQEEAMANSSYPEDMDLYSLDECFEIGQPGVRLKAKLYSLLKDLNHL